MHSVQYGESVSALVAAVHESVGSAQAASNATNDKDLLQQLRDGLDALDAELYYWILAAEKTNLTLERNAATLAPQAQLQWRFVSSFRPYLDREIPVTQEDTRKSNLQRWIDTYAPGLSEKLVILTNNRTELIAKLSNTAESDRDPRAASAQLVSSLDELRQARALLTKAITELFPTTVHRIEQHFYTAGGNSTVLQMGPNNTTTGSSNYTPGLDRPLGVDQRTLRRRWRLPGFTARKRTQDVSRPMINVQQVSRQENTVDPVSLIIAALITGATAAVEDTATEAIKDAYTALKSKIKKMFESKNLETAPLDDPKQNADKIKSSIEASSADSNADIVDESNRVLRLSAQESRVETFQVTIDGNGKVVFVGNNNIIEGDVHM